MMRYAAKPMAPEWPENMRAALPLPRRRSEPSLTARYGISPDFVVAVAALLACPIGLLLAFSN